MNFSDIFGGGSKSKSTESSQSLGQDWQSQNVWEQQAPYLQQGFATAADLMQSGGGTVVPFSDPTQQAMGMVQNRALSGSPTLQNANYFNQALTSGMAIPDPSAGFAGLNSLASTPSFYDVSAPSFDVQGFMAANGGMGGGGAGNIGSFRDVDTSGNNHLQSVQGGSFLGSNPFLSQMFDSAAGDVTRNFTNSVMPTLNATFGAGGRTGSGIHQGTLGEANNNLAGQLQGMGADMYGNAYQFERGQQDTAANNLMNNRYQTQAANQGADVDVMGMRNQANMQAGSQSSAMGRAALGAQVDLARMGLDAQISNQGAYDASLGRMLNASNSISDNYFSGLNAGIAGMSAAPGLAAADYADINPLFQVGGMVDDKAAQMASQPYDLLNWYMQTLGNPIMTQDAYGYDAATGTATRKDSSSGGMFAPIGLTKSVPGMPA